MGYTEILYCFKKPAILNDFTYTFCVQFLCQKNFQETWLWFRKPTRSKTKLAYVHIAGHLTSVSSSEKAICQLFIAVNCSSHHLFYNKGAIIHCYLSGYTIYCTGPKNALSSLIIIASCEMPSDSTETCVNVDVDAICVYFFYINCDA